MERKQLLDTLRRMQVQTGSLVCLGCGQEHWPGEESPYPVTHWMPLPEPPEEVRGNET